MFYTYLWLREDGTPYYVGKGKGNRAYRKHRNGSAPPLGRIIFYIAKDELDALETEAILIWYYGRKDLGTGCLINFTNGGDGVSGLSDETRRKISVRKQGHRVSQETRNKISKSLQRHVGHKHTQKAKDKIRAFRKSLYTSNEERNKARLLALGRAKKTHCKRGHLRIPENLYGKGCKFCMLITQRIRRTSRKK